MLRAVVLVREDMYYVNVVFNLVATQVSETTINYNIGQKKDDSEKLGCE